MKPKIKYDKLCIQNRWKQKKYARNSEWTIIGISTRWFSPTNFCYRFSFFGLELSFWFLRKFSNRSN
jgi:hypothetical protein